MAEASLAADLAGALDPISILTNAGIVPDAWQVEALRHWREDHLLLCCRQSGKSTVAASLGTWVATYVPEALVVLVSRAERQSGELFRKCRLLYDRQPNAGPLRKDTGLQLELANRSRIIALPGSEETVRGLSGAALIIIDEAARVEEEMLSAVLPMGATTNAPLWALSTPYGQRGWFHEEWTEGQDWRRVKLVADQCPRISPEWLAKQQRKLAPWMFQQEYECKFVDTDAAVFGSELLRAAINDEEAALWH